MNKLNQWAERLILPLLLILLTTLYIISISDKSKKIISHKNTSRITKHNNQSIPKELLQFHIKDIYNTQNSIAYIEYVINHGSYWQHYKGGIMEGGYISKEDTHMVVCYVLELSGRKCPEQYPQKAQMYFSSVCAGCHGNDGKGLHGNYPDLTKKHLIGLQRIKKD